MNLSTFATDRGFAAAVQRDLQVSSAREGSAIQRRQRLIHWAGSALLKTAPLPFPSMAAANAKVNYYQPGEEAMIAGQTYIRDIDNQNKKVWVPAN